MSMISPSNLDSLAPKKLGHFRESNNLGTLADIYLDDTNIVIWKRELNNKILNAANHIIDSNTSLELLQIVTPQDTYSHLEKLLGSTKMARILCKDIESLVDIFCNLFDLKQVGLRLAVLDRAMCPRFHVDGVPCRLVTTYQGVATEWLPHHSADRSKLGMGNQGKPVEESGLFQNAADIQQLSQGDVALLKGEGWAGNQGAGLIHRSPSLNLNSRRLLLTIDFVD